MSAPTVAEPQMLAPGCLVCRQPVSWDDEKACADEQKRKVSKGVVGHGGKSITVHCLCERCREIVASVRQ